MRNHVLQAPWLREYAAAGITDKVAVRNLQVTAKVGRDAWGRIKEQPVLISAILSFDKPFATDSDSLNTTTVNYGVLSKDVRSLADSLSEPGEAPGKFASRIALQAATTASPADPFAYEIDVFLPKASLAGDGVGFSHSVLNKADTTTYEVLYLKNLRIPCIVGINDNERQAKQPLIISIWIENPPEGADVLVNVLEVAVVKFVEASSYETLEKLANMIVQELASTPVLERQSKAAPTWIRVRIEKPIAVPFADAPWVEVYRPVPGL